MFFSELTMSKITNPFASTFEVNGISNGGVKADNNFLNITVPSPKPDKRIKGVTVFRPILYGNISYRLERPPSKNQTLSSRSLQDDNQDWFRWTVYIRGIENEDLSYFIKKVVFHLHESYTEPVRVIENGPFELTEEGIEINLFLLDTHLYIFQVGDNLRSELKYFFMTSSLLKI